MHPLKHSRDGYVMLISVLIAGAVGTAIAVALLLLGNAASRRSYLENQMFMAKALADACMEKALMQIRLSASFTGTSSTSVGYGICEFQVVNTGGSHRTVTASSTVGTVVRKATVTIDQIQPLIRITDWQEVPD